MAVYDNFNKRISAFGDRVKKRQKDVTDTMRMSSRLKELDTQLSTDYEKLGRSYYATVKNRTDKQNDINGLCVEIDQLEEEKSDLNKEINILKGFRICPNCGSAVTKGSTYCNNCGMKMPEEIQHSADPRKRCINCGALLEEGQLFCTECGSRVEQETTEASAEEKVEQVCPSCGALVKEGQKFCVNCGMDLTKADEQQALDDEGDNQLDTQAETQGGKICPNCGAPLEEGQLFCTECGAKVEEQSSSVEKFFESLNNTYKKEDNLEQSITHMNMDEEESSGVTDEDEFLEEEMIQTAGAVKRIIGVTDEDKFTEEGIATEGGMEKGVESKDLSGIDNTEEIIEHEKTVPDEEENLPIICPKCGNLIKPGQRFCTYCGAPVDIKKANDGDDR